MCCVCVVELWGKWKVIWASDDSLAPSDLEAVILDLREHPACMGCYIAEESWPACRKLISGIGEGREAGGLMLQMSHMSEPSECSLFAKSRWMQHLSTHHHTLPAQPS
jgi:hypothetical protein